MLIFFLVVAALIFAFAVSLSLWLGSRPKPSAAPDGTPYSDAVIVATAKSLKGAGRTLTSITGAGLLACAGWYFLYYQSDTQIGHRKVTAVAKACENRSMAYIMSQNFVKRGLKSPGSAKFPGLSQVKAEAIGECRFLIAAFLDAQNSFGAMLRTNYSAEMEYLPDTKMWRAHNLQVE